MTVELNNGEKIALSDQINPTSGNEDLVLQIYLHNYVRQAFVSIPKAKE